MAPFYKQSWFAPVASAATTFLFPSLGSAVGGAANSLLGGALSEGAANALGSSLIGGGIGALSNGGQGALTGALAGGLTSGLMSSTGLTGGLSGLLSNGTAQADPTKLIASGAGANATGVAEQAAAAGKTASGGALSGILGGGISPGLIAGMALMGGLGSAMSGGQKQQQQGAPVTTTDPNMTRGLSQVAFNRTQTPYEGDPKTYGMRAQHNYFNNNAVPAADGGYIDEHPMRSERTEYEQAHARLRQADQARRPPVRETSAMREIRNWRNMQAIDAGERTGYADGGPVMGGMPQMPQGMPKMPPQAMMGQRPGMPPMGMGRMQGALPQGRPDGMPPMGGPGGGMRRGPMGDRAGALAAMAQQNGRAPFARGGVSGPGTGRSDDIPAVLSDGEYILDAESVAMLGDGSSKAGAQRLDQMRAELRRHKGSALARGQISPDAKPPLAYIRGAR